ncbi:MAG TPA: hypothetical protein VJV03_09020, partial [Pyrinomonadaceae bacterium]|nr:hypothetical protein [Pyrinomonadaceae bacterium]
IPGKHLATKIIERLLDQLDAAKRQFAPRSSKQTVQLLHRLAKQQIDEPEALIRFHEILLFITAYPQTAAARQLAQSILNKFGERVTSIRDAGIDLTPLETPEVSGIAGTIVSDTFTYPIVSWLVRKQPRRVDLDWEWFEDENRLSETWPRFMPLLEEDAYVEANVPYQQWLRSAAGGERDLTWLIKRFEALPLSQKEKAELFDSQKLYVRWNPAFRSTRSGMRLPVKNVFYHRGPLIARRDISLPAELQAPPPRLELLNAKRGEAILDLTREASTIRYRELYGFTHGDPSKVFRANLGRGVDVFVTQLPPTARLPLRAYHAAVFFKNGVPVGYFEGLSLFERMESGFNLYYTFRDGETAWLYARTLNIFRHLLGVTSFAIDPYQIGYENEEGIESGAFWFYRKLGFRPTSPAVKKLLSKEEAKLTARGDYRTSASTLRKLAQGPMIFELDKSQEGRWDKFQMRNIGLKAQRLMASKFNGNPDALRAASAKSLANILKVEVGKLGENHRAVFTDFALCLCLVKDLGGWTKPEKQLLIEIIAAKANALEAKYLKLMQGHQRLRRELIEMGSS